MTSPIVGTRFGRLVVIGAAAPARDKRGKRLPMLACRCDRGVEKTFHQRNVTRGLSSSCGCLTLGRAAAARRALRTDSIAYSTAHMRTRLDRGPADQHECLCGRPAHDWAYDHTDPAELVTEQGWPYSADPNHYVALCLYCHREFDGLMREVRACA